MPFPSRSDYEALVYGLSQTNPELIRESTLRLYSTSALTARLEGEVIFNHGITLKIREFIDFKVGRIVDYSYTLYRAGQKIRWYDPQPHPEVPGLANTFPHHFHEEPDIKHNRKPAKGISFEAPNLTTLVDAYIQLNKN
jgi:hypothetical protein